MKKLLVVILSLVMIPLHVLASEYSKPIEADGVVYTVEKIYLSDKFNSTTDIEADKVLVVEILAENTTDEEVYIDRTVEVYGDDLKLENYPYTGIKSVKIAPHKKGKAVQAFAVVGDIENYELLFKKAMFEDISSEPLEISKSDLSEAPSEGASSQSDSGSENEEESSQSELKSESEELNNDSEIPESKSVTKEELDKILADYEAVKDEKAETFTVVDDKIKGTLEAIKNNSASSKVAKLAMESMAYYALLSQLINEHYPYYTLDIQVEEGVTLISFYEGEVNFDLTGTFQ